MDKVTILNIQRFSLEDGPGIRTTIFLKSCPLRCLWCANPESQHKKKELMIDWNICIGCKLCVSACEYGATTYENNRIVFDRKRCVLCGKCEEVCPVNAREIAGKDMSYNEIVEQVKSDKIFYDNSGGGVTVSGGEPTLFPEFITYLSKVCKKNNIHLAIETCGYCQWDSLEKISDEVDLILFDIKHIDPIKHKELTGRTNKLILDNLKKLSEQKDCNIIVRYPLIPGYNDDYKYVEELGKYLAKIGKIERIEILPYHRLGISKYDQLDKEYQLRDLKPPEEEETKKIRNKLKLYDLDVVVL